MGADIDIEERGTRNVDAESPRQVVRQPSTAIPRLSMKETKGGGGERSALCLSGRRSILGDWE